VNLILVILWEILHEKAAVWMLAVLCGSIRQAEFNRLDIDDKFPRLDSEELNLRFSLRWWSAIPMPGRYD
jgi:hypothetical protein